MDVPNTEVSFTFTIIMDIKGQIIGQGSCWLNTGPIVVHSICELYMRLLKPVLLVWEPLTVVRFIIMIPKYK